MGSTTARPGTSREGSSPRSSTPSSRRSTFRKRARPSGNAPPDYLPPVTAVLFTCAGQRVDVVTAFARAGGRTIAVDANPLAPAIYHADVHAVVPRIDDPDYLTSLKELIAEHDVNLVVPLTDLDQLLLAEHRDEIDAV